MKRMIMLMPDRSLEIRQYESDDFPGPVNPVQHGTPADEKTYEDMYGLNRRKYLKRSLNGIKAFGTSYVVHFFEVCAGSAVLTQAVRYLGLTTLQPVDKMMGIDLAFSEDCLKVKQMIRESRPLLSHFAPECRIYSVAYHPPKEDDLYRSREDYIENELLAENVGELALYVVGLKLFLSIENPPASRIYSKRNTNCCIHLQDFSSLH